MTTPPGRGHVGIEDLGTILGVWAHPDDECYLMAGTSAMAAEHGSRVACLTATAGEAGETADEGRWPRADLATIRRGELAACLELLGIADHTWLDLPDGALPAIDPERGIGLVCEVVERVRPDTLLTFGPDGMTGHTDHITIGAWAIEATERVMGTGCRVLHATKTAAWAARFAPENQAIGVEPPITRPDELALHVDLTGPALDRKVSALTVQASQTSGLAAMMGDATYRAWVADEFWVDAGRR